MCEQLVAPLRCAPTLRAGHAGMPLPSLGRRLRWGRTPRNWGVNRDAFEWLHDEKEYLTCPQDPRRPVAAPSPHRPSGAPGPVVRRAPLGARVRRVVGGVGGRLLPCHAPACCHGVASPAAGVGKWLRLLSDPLALPCHWLWLLVLPSSLQSLTGPQGGPEPFSELADQLGGRLAAGG